VLILINNYFCKRLISKYYDCNYLIQLIIIINLMITTSKQLQQKNMVKRTVF